GVCLDRGAVQQDPSESRRHLKERTDRGPWNTRPALPHPVDSKDRRTWHRESTHHFTDASVRDQTHGRPDCTGLRIWGGVPREPRALARVLHGGASVSLRTVRRDLRRPHGMAALAEGEGGATELESRSDSVKMIVTVVG